MQKNKLKYNLPVVASHEISIKVADYIAQTLMEYREEIHKMF
jgi:hypothetical protein